MDATCLHGILRGAFLAIFVGVSVSASAQLATGANHGLERLEVCASSEGAEPFASRGQALITFDDIQVYLERRVPEVHRSTFLTDPDRIGKMLRNLATPRQLAVLALEEGIHERPKIQAKMLQGLVTLLADEYIAEYASRKRLDDYDAMAREAYMRSDRKTEKRFTFSQILIRLDEETVGGLEKLREIIRISERLDKEPDQFDELALEFSDDPAFDENQGRYEEIPAEQLVNSISEALGGLEPGEISEPVRSPYGWHILRLEEHHASAPAGFEEVRDKYVQQAIERHRELIQGRLLAELSDKPLVIREGAVEAVLEKYDSGFDVFNSEQR